MTDKSTIKMIAILFIIVLLAGCSQTEKRGVTHTKISWIKDIDQALAQAKELDKPVMIEFMATWCSSCNKMEDSTFSNLDVIKKSSAFITTRIDVDKQGDVANTYKSNAGKYGGIGIPNILFLDPSGEELLHLVEYQGPETFIAIMDSALTLANQ